MATPLPPRRRNWPALALLVVVLGLGGVIVTKFLTSAIDFYCNVDEVGHKSGCEAGRRLRIQGTVDEGSVEHSGAVTDFRISFNGVTKEVRYEGDPGGLFQECIPVVVHGVLDASDVFEGDKLEVKHSNEYAAKNPERLDPSKSAACSQTQA
jgi:cytochrome c-type biogenesis protein CcmE